MNPSSPSLPRWWLAAAFPLLAALALPAAEPTSAPKWTTITYNVYAYAGYPKVDDTVPVLEAARSQMPERIALELALYRPDIVTLQEAPPEPEVARTAEKLGMRYAYFKGGRFPGAVLTRFEIVSAQNCPLVAGGEPGPLFSRHWGKALLRAGRTEIMIYSVHLHPSDDALRAREVDEVLKVIAADRRPGREFILQGDFNHEPIQVEYGRWAGAGLTDAWAAKGVEQRNTIKSTFPNRTVDYIWLSPGLASRLIRCRVLFTGAFRTNPLDERSFALSDHVPVLAELNAP